MDTVTYPNADVQQFLTARFALMRLSLADRNESARELIKRYRVLWSPGFVVLNHTETELRRFIGFQRPKDFLAELRVALGKVLLLGREPAAAEAEFRAAADVEPPAPVSAEGLYWAGVAAYLQEKRPLEFLRDYWVELGRRFPESRWWTHADVFREL